MPLSLFIKGAIVELFKYKGLKMKIQNVARLISIGAIAFVMAGCGGGSSPSGDTGSSVTPPPSNTEPPSTDVPEPATSPFNPMKDVHDGDLLTIGTFLVMAQIIIISLCLKKGTLLYMQVLLHTSMMKTLMKLKLKLLTHQV